MERVVLSTMTYPKEYVYNMDTSHNILSCFFERQFVSVVVYISSDCI